MNRIISIITPSLIQSKQLERTIKSVLNQFGDFYIDYIIADGGSTDNSIEVIKKYDLLLKTKKYPIQCKDIELRWWSKKDKGQTSALNEGFRKARGEICAWINSDDWYEDRTCDFIVKKFKDNPNVDIIYGNCFEVFEQGSIKKGEAMQSDFKKNLEEGCIISQPAAFFKKEALIKVGYLDESLTYCMDYDLWLKILKNGKAKYYDKDLAYFRVWENSKTSKNIKGFHNEENLIRKKYGGSIINPGSIHRLRQKIKLLNFIKKRNPKFYHTSKKIVYRVINLFRHGK